MIKRLFIVVMTIGLVFFFTSSAAAQSSYSFSLDREVTNVFWNSDGTLAVDYRFTFTNNPGGHVIDFVDVGMPNGNFSRDSIIADIQGHALSISSDYQGQGGYGFAVDMGAYAIQPGQQGTVHVYVGRISRVLYKDSNNPDMYASAVFSPTWFGSQYVHGLTDLTVTFHLPPGVLADEPRYHNMSAWPGEKTPQTGFDEQGRVIYTWHSAAASGSTQYKFGASFPKQYIPSDAIVTAPAFDVGAMIAGLLATLGSFCFPVAFCGIFIGVIALSAANESRRKLKYLPPKIQIEGHGIKRGLTAVEAAILMEQPLDKVLTMILFGVIKKGAAQVLSHKPLKIQAMKTQADAPLRDYEVGFLKAFNEDKSRARKIELQGMMVALVKSVSKKMKGFSRKETVAYYRSIMERAWEQIEAAGTPEVQSKMFDEALEWTMLDKDYDGRTRRVFTRPIYAPTWWGGYDPGYRTAHPVVGTSVPSGGRVTLPGANVAASMVRGVQNFSSQVVGDVTKFTSGVTNRTNPIPVSKSGGGRSGGGCACACACAGCACACAGGGR